MTPNARRNERPEASGARSRSRLAAAALSLSLLLTALAVAALALPATALAAAENAPTTLYVGNYQITNGNATTYLKAGSTQGSLVDGSENDWTVKYDPSTATLTLNGATITGNDNISSVPYGAGIYAQCNSGQPVTLTIELIGENIITGNYGIYVNAEMSANSYGTDASLNITGNGSLIVTGTNSHGLFVKSGTGNASLTINDASVVANTTHTYSGAAGICVQSSVSATSSPNLSLAVDGGSLTASGTGNSDGILLYVGSSQATGATTSLTVTDNAIVRAKNGIKAERVDKPTPSGAGIVFDGGKGTVYGDVTLQENLEIGEDESLAIGVGASLNTGSHEVIVNGGTLTGGDKITGTVKYAPAITTESLPSGTVGTAYSQTLAATGSDTITWSVTSDSLPTGLSLDGSTGAITGTPTAEGSSTFTVKAENSYGSDSKEYTLTIDTKQEVSVTGVSLSATSLILTEEETAVLTATVEPANATNQKVTWSSSAPGVATVDADGKVTAVGAGTAVITVTTADGNKTATCTVTVEHDPAGAWSSDADGHWHACETCGDKLDYAAHTPEIVDKQEATCIEEGYTGDTVCSACGHVIAKGAAIPAAGHSWGAWVATEPATCTDDGLEARTCAACGGTQTRTVPALGHSFTSYVSNRDATCTEDGTETATCDNGCGATHTRPDEGSALGHAWGEPAWRWSDDGEEFVASFACARDASHTLELTAKPAATVASEPTCTEPGTTRYYAEVELDGVTYAAEATAADIPALGHRFEDGVCTVCGAEDEGYVAPQRPDPRPEPEPVETDPELPATGDATAAGLLGALACAGATLATGAALRRRSR